MARDGMRTQEQLVREFDIEADNDDSARRFTYEQSIGLQMAAELSREGKSIVRVTPTMARLYSQ